MPPVPKFIPSVAFVLSRRRTVEALTRRLGRCYAFTVPVFGPTVMVSDPVLTKQIFTTSPDVLYNIQPNLSRFLGRVHCSRWTASNTAVGANSLTPPFHGKAIRAYEQIVEEETLREMASWPEGKGIRHLEPMMHIT